MNRTVAEPPVLVAGLLHPVVAEATGARAYSVMLLLVAPLKIIVHATRFAGGTVDPIPLTLPAADRKALPSLGGLPSAPGPHCS